MNHIHYPFIFYLASPILLLRAGKILMMVLSTLLSISMCLRTINFSSIYLSCLRILLNSAILEMILWLHSVESSPIMAATLEFNLSSP